MANNESDWTGAECVPEYRAYSTDLRALQNREWTDVKQSISLLTIQANVYGDSVTCRKSTGEKHFRIKILLIFFLVEIYFHSLHPSSYKIPFSSSIMYRTNN